MHRIHSQLFQVCRIDEYWREYWWIPHVKVSCRDYSSIYAKTPENVDEYSVFAYSWELAYVRLHHSAYVILFQRGNKSMQRVLQVLVQYGYAIHRCWHAHLKNPLRPFISLLEEYGTGTIWVPMGVFVLPDLMGTAWVRGGFHSDKFDSNRVKPGWNVICFCF